MKIDDERLSDSELLIKNRFQDYMNDMQVKMMSLQGINNNTNDKKDSADNIHYENHENDNKSKRQRLFEENLEEVRKELKYNFKEREKIESPNGSQKISVFVKLWCWVIGVKPNSLWMPKTNKDIERMSFIKKLRYKTKLYIKQNKEK